MEIKKANNFPECASCHFITETIKHVKPLLRGKTHVVSIIDCDSVHKSSPIKRIIYDSSYCINGNFGDIHISTPIPIIKCPGEIAKKKANLS